jgi:hypothetical protein
MKIGNNNLLIYIYIYFDKNLESINLSLKTISIFKC